MAFVSLKIAVKVKDTVIHYFCQITVQVSYYNNQYHQLLLQADLVEPYNTCRHH